RLALIHPSEKQESDLAYEPLEKENESPHDLSFEESPKQGDHRPERDAHEEKRNESPKLNDEGTSHVSEKENDYISESGEAKESVSERQSGERSDDEENAREILSQSENDHDENVSAKP
ncbi:hypothetical protein L0F63_003642, partial [Massospora cicadina]